MKNFIIIILLFAVGAGIFGLISQNFNPSQNNQPIACSMEAKLCPDGSYVARTGPKCEFTTCPQASSTSTKVTTGYLSGRVTISPVCPVERIPPDPQCAPKGYSLSINIVGNNFLKQINSDTNGYFNLNLPAGTYNLKPVSANVYPRCMETDNVIVKTNASTTVQVSCDSGIR